MQLLRTLWIRVLLVSLAFTAPLHAGTLAWFRTVLGDIEVELYDQDKPITVKNFIRYVESGRYRDMIFHRCPPDLFTGLSEFVVQGGGFFVANRGTTSNTLAFVPSFGDIPNEFGVGRQFSNVYGTIAMAKRAGQTNSASAQWFFNLNNNSFLDAADPDNYFVVFGHVVRGTNVLNQFIGRSYNNGIIDLSQVHPALGELPVNYIGSRAPTFDDLFYLDISLLKVQVSAIGSSREIAWTSVSNKLNHVEFTPGLPPVWQTLVSTNGTGGTLRVTDINAGAAPRFYRVRVDY